MSLILDNGITTSVLADSFISEHLLLTGNLLYVSSVGGNDSNPGSESEPFATLAAAIAAATANNGDMIIVKSGHTETLASAITVNKAGLKIFGLGAGSSRPNFTVNAAIDGFNITAASVEINGLYFPVGTTAINTARINIDAANVKIRGCTFMCGQYDSESITLTANALYARIESCSFTISANGPDTAIRVESASTAGLVIKDCALNGGDHNWDLGGIYSAVAHTNFIYDSIALTGEASIKHTAAAKGVISNTTAADGSEVQA